MEKLIKQTRRFGKTILKYNCGNMPNALFVMYFCFVTALFVISLAWMFPQHFSGEELSMGVSAGILMALLFVGVILIAALWKKEEPYVRMEGYQFLGLHDLSKERLYGSEDIISRDGEAQNIKEVLEDVIFSQVEVKQALVLVGKSGCGKSTILAFFKQKYKNDYEIADFSGNYIDLQTAMEKRFGLDIDKIIFDITKEKKVILILDQFERFFFLSDDAKDKTWNVIRAFKRRNAAVIISMREEYLSAFLNEFDVNNMMSKDSLQQNGIMRELVNIIKDSTDDVRNKEMNMRHGLLSYKEQACKDNTYMHLESPGFGNCTIIEKRGKTIFYCGDQSDVQVTMNHKKEPSELMKNKCRIVFGDKGERFYEKHKKEPLIKQQIIFHMTEFAVKAQGISASELEEWCQKESLELLNIYFDRQISFCTDSFCALRILYLLSSARTHHISIKIGGLQEGLLECQFNEKGNQILIATIKELQHLQLIRQNTEESDNEYEIAHDFIAESFLNYSNSKISRNVKNAMDLYVADYLSDREEKKAKQRRRDIQKAYKSSYYRICSFVSILCVIGIFVAERFIYNPFDTFWEPWDPYGEMFLFAPIINVISIWYLCRIYDKFVKFYSGKIARFCKIFYIPIMITAVCGMLFYPHVLGFDGLSLFLMGLNVAFLIWKQPYHETSQRELLSYGLKCALMGAIYCISHILFFVWSNGDKFSFLIMGLETTVLWFLVVYAQLAHMTKDFLYSRCMDVICDKI